MPAQLSCDSHMQHGHMAERLSGRARGPLRTKLIAYEVFKQVSWKGAYRHAKRIRQKSWGVEIPLSCPRWTELGTTSRSAFFILPPVSFEGWFPTVVVSRFAGRLWHKMPSQSESFVQCQRRERHWIVYVSWQRLRNLLEQLLVRLAERRLKYLCQSLLLLRYESSSSVLSTNVIAMRLVTCTCILNIRVYFWSSWLPLCIDFVSGMQLKHAS